MFGKIFFLFTLGQRRLKRISGFLCGVKLSVGCLSGGLNGGAGVSNPPWLSYEAVSFTSAFIYDKDNVYHTVVLILNVFRTQERDGTDWPSSAGSISTMDWLEDLSI